MAGAVSRIHYSFFAVGTSRKDQNTYTNAMGADTFFFFLRRLVIIDNKLFADIVFIVFV